MKDAGQPLKVIGKRLSRIDAAERLTGRALYPADLQRSGMAIGRIKRSPHAHARITRIDLTKAKALPGVLAAVAADDFPAIAPGTNIPLGETGADAWYASVIVMARGHVYWRGQPVAAVAAIDPFTADRALDLMEVEYEPLPVLADIAAATASDAPLVHPTRKPKGFDGGAQAPRNSGGRTLIERGAVTEALAGAAATASVDVTIDTAHQGYIEPHACVAEADASGFVTIWASTQGAFTTEIQTAALLGLPHSKIKVVPLEVGGAFGGKITVHVEPVAARLAQLCGRPVKLVTTRAEVLGGGSGPGSAARINVTVGADRSGTIVALDGRYELDSGGLPGTPTTLPMQASAAPYQCANLRLDGVDIVTNKPRSEAYRAPGGIQAAFAVEQAIDELSLKLGMDPLELRRRNAAVTGSQMPIGTPFPAIGLTSIIDLIADHSCWKEPLPAGKMPRGRGLAVGYWRGTSMTSAAHVTVAADGRIMVVIGAVDLTGTRTTMAQVAAEEFGLTIDDVHVETGDTKTAGFTDVSAASRIARTMTAAVSEACQDALSQLRRRAAERLQCTAQDLAYADGVFSVASRGGATITLRDLMQATLNEGAIIGRGVSTKLPLGVEFAAHVCDLEVDPETGHVQILKYTAFQDVGRALNPAAIEGQIEGSVSQGLGWALTEGFVYSADGRLLNPNLLDYRIPTALDVPNIECVLLETPVPGVPYGLRGVAEVPIVPVAAAVGNAIRRAIGVRMQVMPMTPERIRKALRAAK